LQSHQFYIRKILDVERRRIRNLLAIMFPMCTHLVDSIGKKIKVVDEVAAAVGLEKMLPSTRAAQT
jgi:hypothetical protein